MGNSCKDCQYWNLENSAPSRYSGFIFGKVVKVSDCLCEKDSNVPKIPKSEDYWCRKFHRRDEVID